MTSLDVGAISSALRQGSDGIWYGEEREQVHFPAEGYARCLAIEEGSFWFRHRNDCILAAVRAHRPPSGGGVFDVGGGNGFVSLALARAGFEVVLVEPGAEGVHNARRRGVATVVCASLEGARFTAGSLPSCGLFDVLEHTPDDASFLGSIRELLRPDGRLYLTVPAYPRLWSEQDDLAGHFRRYTLDGLEGLLRTAGFEVTYATCFFRLLPPAIFVTRTLPYRLGRRKGRIEMAAVERDHLSPNRSLMPVLSAFAAREARNIGSGRRMRFGASCLAVATRR